MKKSKVKSQKSKLLYKNIIFAALLITLGILFRTVWHLGDNVEFVTTATFLASCYLGKKYSIFIPLVIMAITDWYLGNTYIFIFTWSGYLSIGYLGYLSNLGSLKGGMRILGATGLGVLSSLWFYLWTNFGVWLLDGWGMYPRTIVGLWEAYIFGLPFLRYNLVGNLVLVPVSFLIVETGIKIVGNKKLLIDRSKSVIRL